MAARSGRLSFSRMPSILQGAWQTSESRHVTSIFHQKGCLSPPFGAEIGRKTAIREAIDVAEAPRNQIIEPMAASRVQSLF